MLGQACDSPAEGSAQRFFFSTHLLIRLARESAGTVGRSAGRGVHQGLFRAGNPGKDHAVMQERDHHREQCGFVAPVHGRG